MMFGVAREVRRGHDGPGLGATQPTKRPTTRRPPTPRGLEPRNRPIIGSARDGSSSGPLHHEQGPDLMVQALCLSKGGTTTTTPATGFPAGACQLDASDQPGDLADAAMADPRPAPAGDRNL